MAHHNKPSAYPAHWGQGYHIDPPASRPDVQKSLSTHPQHPEIVRARAIDRVTP
jgi:hypothetical protein